MRVSQRSKAMAFSMVGSWQLAEPQSTANCQLPTVNSLKLDTSPKSFLVPMKILQRLLGVLPAVVAAAVVEVDQPHALDVDAEAHDRLGPALHDALLFALGRLRQLVDVFHCLLRQALHLGEQRRGVLVRESLFHGWPSADRRWPTVNGQPPPASARISCAIAPRPRNASSASDRPRSSRSSSPARRRSSRTRPSPRASSRALCPWP